MRAETWWRTAWGGEERRGDPPSSDRVWLEFVRATEMQMFGFSAPGESTPVSGSDFITGKESGPSSLKQASSGVRSIGMAGQALR